MTIRKKRILTMVCIFLLAFSFLAAAPTQAVQAASASSLNLTRITMSKGQTRTLKLTNNTKQVTWKSSKKSVATVSKAGKVRAKNPGTTKITATVGKKSYTCYVTVSDPDTKSLVVYFSHTGTTKEVAVSIQELTGSDILRIREETKYPTVYSETTALAQKEFNEGILPATTTRVLNWDQYDTIYVGFPIWYYKMPMIVESFLQNYEFDGKTVVPFCTSGGSSISGAMDQINERCEGATVTSGYTANSGSDTEITAWLAEIGILEAAQ